MQLTDELTTSSEGSENSDAQSTEQSKPETERLTLDALFRDESPENGGDNGAGETHQAAPDGKPQGKPKGLKDLAERLQLKPEDLYAIDVPMSDGKSMTLGALKDAFAKQDELTARELEFAERKAKGEAELTRAQTELQMLMAQLPDSARKPELVEAIRRRAEADAKRERELVVKAIPEWSDAETRQKELAGMAEHLADYGFPLAYLSQVLSHRMIRFVRDSYLRKARIESALEQVKAVRKPSVTGKSKPNGSAPKQAEKPTRKQSSRDRILSLMD